MEQSSSIQERRAAIKALVEQNVIEDQQTLASLLHQRCGIKVNQAIISRDLRMLGITKTLVQGKSIYHTPSKDSQREILNLSILDIQHNDHMVVIKTLPALADFVGDYLDAHEEKGILGTLSGENTVFVTPVKGVSIKDFHRTICLLTHFKVKNREEN
jgi:transcriptional regulator of arginine metabolism